MFIGERGSAVTQRYVAPHCDGSVYWREGLHSGM